MASNKRPSAIPTNNEFLVGSHCFLEQCTKLDFLPFPCDKCHETFCLDHRLPSSHNCTAVSVATAEESPSLPPVPPCSLATCADSGIMRTQCEQCQQTFCLPHRHGEDHNCPGSRAHLTKTNAVPFHLPETVIKPVQPPAARAIKAQNPTAIKLRRMKLKASATGEKGIPEDERVFVEVFLLDGTSRPVYLHKQWSVGRAVDGLKRCLGLDAKYDETGIRQKDADFEILSSTVVAEAVSDGMTLELYRKTSN
ncbi:AN1-type zinc finger protein 1-like [Paramacrobiotus metropolitanus]|uniref:AN1-type zinc finger protein 1-like n=1 Tax=Paramacrobiotus metropolitanus TaxID=2943436 RepID=UPI002445A356|nr:AN1-type zinc finger protein 1-like [Paramacrobiotus metropolitanus]